MKDTRILVIDDDESITTTVSKYLAAAGYRVAVINDGEGALAEVRDGGYPVIISDIYIDRVTGLDILRAAKAANPDAAVIIMTARGSVRTTVEAELGGAFEYIAKPFEMRDLLKVVKHAETAAVEAPRRGRFGGPRAVRQYDRLFTSYGWCVQARGTFGQIGRHGAHCR